MNQKRPIPIPDICSYIYERTGVIKTRQTIYKWIKNGKLKAIKLAGQLFSRPEWIDDCLEKMK